MQSLSRRLIGLVRARDAAPSDLADAERYVRDWLGSFVAGGAASPGRILRAYGGLDAPRTGEEGTSGGGSVEDRVFLTAALSHVTETDDLHNASVTHPGCVVVPVAMVLAAELGRRGHDVLRATLAGYEVMTRVGEALGPAHYRAFHNTATAGVFGSAAAAATLLGLDEDRFVWALGSAGTQAAGLWQFNEEGAMSKPLHAGHAAAAGLRAARLAAAGWTGAERILEGEKGVFRTLCPDARPEAVLAPAAGWKLPETSMKPYPCCRHVHSAIDATLELRAALGGDALAARGTRTIEAVRIRSYPAALDVTDRPRVASPHDARFSIQYAVASALLRGRPGLEAFAPDAVEDADVQALLPRITVEVSPALADAYPARWGAHVEVDAEDGRQLEATRPSAHGDPDAPLDDAALDAKARGLMSWAGLSDRDIDNLLRRCRALVDDGPAFEPRSGGEDPPTLPSSNP